VTDPAPASGIYQRGDPTEVVAKVGLKNSGRTRGVIRSCSFWLHLATLNFRAVTVHFIHRNNAAN
jgi:hypothetical protein